jgi:gamma-D-glutamyl-L-lysine dipeptidyl-peptidase
MTEKVQEIISNIAAHYADTRLNVFSVQIKTLAGQDLSLSGRVLEQANLTALLAALAQQFPDLRVDVSEVRILRQPKNPTLSLATTLTSVHVGPTWLAEVSSHLVFGNQVEQLDESDRWIYARQTDGYLAWVYKPFLTPSLPPVATHIVLAPVRELRSEPEPDAPVLTRIMSGTRVRMDSIQGAWAQVSAHLTGWLPLADLRALEAFPQTTEDKRQQMMIDAQRMLGVPYLWGGTASNGIDCSGFVRLLHAWLGISIPRDADLQSVAARPVAAPYLPGDLLFFSDGEPPRHITHVAVSLGGSKIIHSSRSCNGVYYDDLENRADLRAEFAQAGTFL